MRPSARKRQYRCEQRACVFQGTYKLLLRWLALYPCHNPPCLLFAPRALSASGARFRPALRAHTRQLVAQGRACAQTVSLRAAPARKTPATQGARAACAADFAAVIWSSFSSSCNPGCPLSCMSLLSENRHALALRRVDALPGATASNTPCASTCGLVAMTSAQHAEGHRFNPDQVYVLTLAVSV